MSERTSSRWGLVLISPWLLGFLIFTAGPMLASLYLSFCKYDLHTLSFVGAKNYDVLLHEPRFWKSLGNTAIYVLFAVPLGLTGSLLIAVLLNQKVKAIPIFRTLFYLPSLVPAVASSLVHRLPGTYRRFRPTPRTARHPSDPRGQRLPLPSWQEHDRRRQRRRS